MALPHTWGKPYRFIDHVNDFKDEFLVERRVFAYQEITVNGTTYMAYGVMSTDNTDVPNPDYTETYWYAPEIGSIVKADFGGIEIALVEYDPQ